MEYCADNRILLHITEDVIFKINLSRNFDMMRLLISNFIQLRRPISETNLESIRRVSERNQDDPESADLLSGRQNKKGQHIKAPHAAFKEKYLQLSDFVCNIFTNKMTFFDDHRQRKRTL